jgi:hypothetical protein
MACGCSLFMGSSPHASSLRPDRYRITRPGRWRGMGSVGWSIGSMSPLGVAVPAKYRTDIGKSSLNEQRGPAQTKRTALAAGCTLEAGAVRGKGRRSRSLFLDQDSV